MATRAICGKPLGPNPMGDDDEPCNLDPGHDGSCGLDSGLDLEWLRARLATAERQRGELRAIVTQLTAPEPYTYHDDEGEVDAEICPVCEDEIMSGSTTLGCGGECPGFAGRALLARIESEVDGG